MNRAYEISHMAKGFMMPSIPNILFYVAILFVLLAP